MAPQIPPSQLGERLVAIEPRRGRGAIGEQRIGGLLAPATAAADDSPSSACITTCASSLVPAGKPARASSAPSSRRVRVTPVAQRPFDDSCRAGHYAGIEPELAVVGRHPALHVGCGELQHPADVVPGNEVPGGTQDVSAEDAALLDRVLDRGVGRACRRAQREPPLGGPVFLGLHRAEPRDHPGRRQPTGSGDALVIKSLLGNPRAQCATLVRVTICPA